VSGRIAAITGGTGFVGSHIVAALAGAGWRVRLLARRAPLHPLLTGIPLELTLGDLADAAALARLVAGASLVVHAAGLVKARCAADFFAVNEAGTQRLAAAVAAGADADADADAAHVVLISSQAARHPALSAYAASKLAAERALAATLPPARWTVLRPGVVYGTWDHEGAALLRMASGRIALVPRPPDLRLAMIHATDLAAAVLACAAGPAGLFEVADAAPEGHAYSDILHQMSVRLGTAPHVLPVPDALFTLAGAATDGFAALTRRPAIFGRGKAREILHRDWRPDPALRLPATLWSPRMTLQDGLADTVSWWKQTS
jgi:nucleoside-diphosphate-sugar epimerase